MTRYSDNEMCKIARAEYKRGKSEAITLIDHELRALYFLVKKGHDARIEAEIKVLEKLKGELAK